MVRRGIDRDGKKWKVKMPLDYGYILGSRSAEYGNDAVDVFVGPDKTSDRVFVVHTIDPDTGQYDEDKCFIGLSSPAQAKKYFKMAYNPWKRYYGDMEELSFRDFKEKVLNTKNAPNVIRGHKRVG